MDHSKLVVIALRVTGSGRIKHYCTGYGISSSRSSAKPMKRCPSCQRELSGDTEWRVVVKCDVCGKTSAITKICARCNTRGDYRGVYFTAEYSTDISCTSCGRYRRIYHEYKLLAWQI